jgi:hypothetical protein
VSKLLDFHFNKIKSNPNYCIGVYINNNFPFDENLILSQMAKTKMQLTPSFFCVQSRDLSFLKQINQIYSDQILNFTNELFDLLSLTIVSSKQSLPEKLLKKEIISCSDSSYYFRFNKKLISKFV